MADTLAPTVTDEERAAAAAFDAVIGDEAPAPVRAPKVEPVQETTEAAPVADERDYEAEARAMGWKPADEWSGDPTKHRDAKTFVELGFSEEEIVSDLQGIYGLFHPDDLGKVKKAVDDHLSGHTNSSSASHGHRQARTRRCACCR